MTAERETVTVRNNEPRVITLPGEIRLTPGENEVDKMAWDRAVAKGYTKDLLEQDAGPERPDVSPPDRKVLEVLNRAAKPLIPKNIKITLKDVPDAQAILMVKDSNETNLAIWAQTEKRPAVLAEIATRLESLKAGK